MPQLAHLTQQASAVMSSEGIIFPFLISIAYNYNIRREFPWDSLGKQFIRYVDTTIGLAWFGAVREKQRDRERPQPTENQAKHG